MPVPIPARTAEIVAGNHIPSALLDQFGAMSFLAMGAARRLGVFDALAGERHTASDLATVLSTDPDATRTLLDALVAYDYVETDGSTYAARPAAQTWLVTGGADDYATVVDFWYDAITNLWGAMPDAVRTGQPQHDFYAWLGEDDDRARGFGQMQDGNAAAVSDVVVSLVRDQVGHKAPRVLDVGGGWGRYAQAFCAAFPGAEAIVIDLDDTVQGGRARVVEAGLADRISFVPGDVRTADLPENQDIAILANVLHTFDDDTAADLVRRAAHALRPGGIVVVVDHLADQLDGIDSLRTAQVRGFDLHLLQTQSGRLPTAERLTTWLTDAGLTQVRLHSAEQFPVDHVVTARR